MSDQDRIKLAEAMNLLPEPFKDWDEYKHAVQLHTGKVLEILRELIPDPENNANDDYAVLEWLRSYTLRCPQDSRIEALEFAYAVFSILRGNDLSEYQIGDYARAALKVIDRAG